MKARSLLQGLFTYLTRNIGHENLSLKYANVLFCDPFPFLSVASLLEALKNAI